jgi:hypothetical protein
MTRVTISLPAGFKRGVEDSWLVADAVVPCAGPVGKSFAGSTLILVEGQRPIRRETTTMPTAVSRKKDTNRRTIVPEVTILTARSDFNEVILFTNFLWFH